jgi:DNA-binding NarL/FixJ family response regulator
LGADPQGPEPDDVIVSDPSQGAKEVLRDYDDCRHVAFTCRRDESFVLRTLRAGYQGYLLHATPVGEVAGALQRVAAGEGVVASELASRIAISGARLGDADFWPGMSCGLTRRESEVLEGISHGSSTRQIADQLYVGEETVRSHLKSLYQKLGVSGRSAAVAHAFRRGILSADSA